MSDYDFRSVRCHDVIEGIDTHGQIQRGRVVEILRESGEPRWYGLAPVDSTDVCGTWYVRQVDLLVVIERARPLAS